MSPTQQVLPPGVPGYLKFTPYPHDFATARELIKQANPSDTKVTVWTDDRTPDRRAGGYLRGLLARLGLSAKLRVVSAAAYYRTVASPNTPDLDAGFGSWAPLLPHPNQYFELFNGSAIGHADNPNLAQLDDPAVNERDRAPCRAAARRDHRGRLHHPRPQRDGEGALGAVGEPEGVDVHL